MKIALIGYGKMGKAIEEIAVERGHEIVVRAGIAGFSDEEVQRADVAIEFTRPDAAVSNLTQLINAGVPTVCGTTGWTEQAAAIEQLCTTKKGSLLHASNFSLGVNLFFELNIQLTKLMQGHSDYQAEMLEIHHTAKKDAPSGTAITLAHGLMDNDHRYNHWSLNGTDGNDALPIYAERIDPTPGTHTVTWKSDIDDISISHIAHSRKGFALGSVLAAEYIHNKKGIFTMRDVLGLNK